MNEAITGQGKVVTLPNGARRIDYIRDSFYNAKTGLHGEKEASRSDIKKAINTMLEEAGRKGEQIPYQIVFAATKTDEDPRIAARAREVVRSEKRAEREAAAEAEKKAKAEAKKFAAEKKAKAEAAAVKSKK